MLELFCYSQLCLSDEEQLITKLLTSNFHSNYLKLFNYYPIPQSTDVKWQNGGSILVSSVVCRVELHVYSYIDFNLKLSKRVNIQSVSVLASFGNFNLPPRCDMTDKSQKGEDNFGF